MKNHINHSLQYKNDTIRLNITNTIELKIALDPVEAQPEVVLSVDKHSTLVLVST